MKLVITVLLTLLVGTAVVVALLCYVFDRLLPPNEDPGETD